MSEPILKIENLHVVYKTDESTVYAVNGVDLELFSGETLDILSSYPSTAPSGTASSVLRMLLYHSHCESTASVSCFSPGHFRRRNSRLVSCYALFECMAASEPTS